MDSLSSYSGSRTFEAIPQGSSREALCHGYKPVVEDCQYGRMVTGYFPDTPHPAGEKECGAMPRYLILCTKVIILGSTVQVTDR